MVDEVKAWAVLVQAVRAAEVVGVVGTQERCSCERW